jgi:purine-binding chemotaxis protein CheW
VSLLVLTFETNGERFGVDAAIVVEVIRSCATTPLPGAPEAIEGVLDLRGELVPVVDLRARSAGIPRPISTDDHLIVLLAGEEKLAVRVDRVLDLASIEGDRRSAPLPLLEEVGFSSVLARIGGHLIVISSPDSLLPEKEHERAREAIAARRGEP